MVFLLKTFEGDLAVIGVGIVAIQGNIWTRKMPSTIFELPRC
jgi:hypothetical protein